MRRPIEALRRGAERLGDPMTGTTVLAVLMVAGGIAAIAVAYWGVSRSGFIPRQISLALSGSIGGIGLIGLGLGLLEVQVSRRAAAKRARNISLLTERAEVLVRFVDALKRSLARSPIVGEGPRQVGGDEQEGQR